MNKKNSKKSRFVRSIVEHAKYYKNKSISEKLMEAIKLSNLCLNFAQAARRAGIHGK